MFSSHVAARTDRERSEIHSRIVDLFARLGVASEYPVIRHKSRLLAAMMARDSATSIAMQLTVAATQVGADIVRLAEKTDQDTES